MPLIGSFATMPLGDLLQWVGVANKTGTLELERQKVRKRILVRHGRVVTCASEDPSDLLGHWLVSRGRISEDVLRLALARQEQDKRFLGDLLVEMGALTKPDLLRQLAAKTEEAIFALFEWTDAEFRFVEGEPDPGNTFSVDLRVEDILLKGAQRFDEAQRIRTVFNDPGIVLRRTGKLPPAEVFRNRMARSLFEAVNGERTVAEILLHAHGSEFLVTKFLFELHRIGAVEIAGVVPVPAPAPTPVSEPAAVETVHFDLPPAPAAAPAESDVEAARRLMAAGDFDSALDLLDRAYRAQPGDEALRRMVAEAEAAFVEKAYRHYLPPGKVPVLLKPPQTLQAEQLSPAEFFLLSRMDGSWDVRSIIQIAPLREVEALRTLKRLRERGILELRDPS